MSMMDRIVDPDEPLERIHPLPGVVVHGHVVDFWPDGDSAYDMTCAACQAQTNMRWVGSRSHIYCPACGVLMATLENRSDNAASDGAGE